MAVLLTTNHGNIKLELDAERRRRPSKTSSPTSTSGHYNGTIFHRVIDGFMIQGGGFEPGMKQKPTNAADRKRSQERPEERPLHASPWRAPRDPHSASAQFFINIKNNGFLDYPGQDGWGYCVFGKVIEGTEVVDKIKAVKPRAAACTPTCRWKTWSSKKRKWSDRHARHAQLAMSS